MNLARHRALAATLGSLCAVVLAGSLAATASAAAPKPFGHACQAQNGVRFCPTTDLAHRVPTFDGVPLDVDVTLPREGQRAVPDDRDAARLGRQQDRLRVEHRRAATARRPTTTTTTTTPSTATRSSTTRPAASATPAAAGRAAITRVPAARATSASPTRRYEARDTQYLLGLLADEGITKPQRDRRHRHLLRRRPEHGARLPRQQDPPARRQARALAQPRRASRCTIAAAYPRWPWSDLVDALLPNGRFLDTQVAPVEQSLNPIGVPIQSYVAGLFALGNVERLLLRRRAGLDPVHEPRRRTSPRTSPTSTPASRSRPTRRRR